MSNIDKQYKLVWKDTFEVEGKPSSDIWDYEYGNLNNGNNEKQFYTDRIENCYVDNGVLHIKCIKEEHEGCQYTSAKLTTKGKRSFQYGKFVAEVKLPQGKGTWPAVWFMPDDFPKVRWPECGEIDFVEYIGRKPSKIHFSLHTGLYNHNKDSQYTTIVDHEGIENEFVTFEMIWEESFITYSINGSEVARFEAGEDGKDSGEGGWPFNKPYYLMINLAIGGHWGGDIDDSVLPAEFLIKSIKYYEKV